jgi:hypothetical protein
VTDEELAELKAAWQRAEVRRWYSRHELFRQYQVALKQREREGAA